MSGAMQALRPTLERARRFWRASPLPAFLRWWGGALAASLPSTWRRHLGSGARWLLLERDDALWRVRREGDADAIARWSVDASPAEQRAVLDAVPGEAEIEDRRLALLLPATQVLQRRLVLPKAAAEDLTRVGAFEMDRQTPFRVDQVHYAMRELAAPAGAGRIVVELVAVPRIMLDPQLAQLREAGIAVDAVDVAAGDGRMGVNLLPADQTPHRRRPRLRLNLALAGGCLLLLVLVLWQWLHNREVALERMRDEVAALRTQAQAVAALRQQWQDEVGAAGFLARRKRQAISRLALLDELTRRLPASAWLERFSLDGSGQFTMQGQAQQAIKLIDALKESPLIVDPNFQGSIQPDPASGKDRFYLLAQLRQPAASAAKPAAGDAR